jgi:hypothetical protein
LTIDQNFIVKRQAGVFSSELFMLLEFYVALCFFLFYVVIPFKFGVQYHLKVFDFLFRRSYDFFMTSVGGLFNLFLVKLICTDLSSLSSLRAGQFLFAIIASEFAQ